MGHAHTQTPSRDTSSALFLIGAQVFIVLLLDCPERRYIGNPAKKSKNFSREKKPDRCGTVALVRLAYSWGLQGSPQNRKSRLSGPGKNRAVHVRCRALLAPQPSANGTQLTSATAPCGERSVVDARRLVPAFDQNAMFDDNDILEITSTTSPSCAASRLIETAMRTNLPAKLSAAQNSAIRDPISHSPITRYRVPGQLTRTSRRQSPCFLRPLRVA